MVHGKRSAIVRWVVQVCGKRTSNFKLLNDLSNIFDKTIEYILGTSDDDKSPKLNDSQIEQLGAWAIDDDCRKVIKDYMSLDEFGKADLAFIMHSLSWLAPNGTVAIVCFPGIMYCGGAEQKIRKYLIDNNFIDCVIQLPSNLFFGTSIATCIMVMKRGKADSKTLFIDVTNECIKVTNNNKLTAKNMNRIVETFANREEVVHFSHLASYDEIAGNDYNLSVSTYVEAEDTREKVDIQKLNAEIEEIVLREDELRAAIRTIIEEIEG